MFIKPIEKFEGTLIERNRERMNEIKSLIENGDYIQVIDDLFNAKENNNASEFKNIITNNLFFENASKWAMQRLYNSNITKYNFISEYAATGKYGYNKTIVMLGLL